MEIPITWLEPSRSMTEQHFKRVSPLVLVFFTALLVVPGSLAQQAQVTVASTASAESSFKYIANTLTAFRTTGRLTNNPGIDGADLEHFILLLDEYYNQFTQGFGSNSAMCSFYRDPENGRMTIEERGELAFSFLRDLPARLDRYISIDQDFQDEVEIQFGSILKDNINVIKLDAVSNQRLPASEFDEAAKINFADTASS